METSARRTARLIFFPVLHEKRCEKLVSSRIRDSESFHVMETFGRLTLASQKLNLVRFVPWFFLYGHLIALCSLCRAQ